jgi:phage baseplate assembly protein W
MALAKTERFGKDLRLLQNLERQTSRERGSDLLVRPRLRSSRMDLEVIDAVDNIRQALLLRFLTPVGEMEALGHPGYGSRLVELIGELNNERTRNRAKMFVLQSLAAEPRVERVLSVRVDENRTDHARIDITAELLTVASSTPLNLVFPFFLET